MTVQRVRFVDAPPPISGPQDPRSVWMERLRLLIDRPGDWAEVYTGTATACHQAAANLKQRRYHVPPGGWEFTVRSFRRGHDAFSRDTSPRAVLYARFLGADEPDANTDFWAQNNVSAAIWDQYGRRICPVCEFRPLVLSEGVFVGSYPDACDECSRKAALPGIEHGVETSYRKKGCRCPECRAAARAAHRERQQRRAS